MLLKYLCMASNNVRDGNNWVWMEPLKLVLIIVSIHCKSCVLCMIVHTSELRSMSLHLLPPPMKHGPWTLNLCGKHSIPSNLPIHTSLEGTTSTLSLVLVIISCIQPFILHTILTHLQAWAQFVSCMFSTARSCSLTLVLRHTYIPCRQHSLQSTSQHPLLTWSLQTLYSLLRVMAL